MASQPSAIASRKVRLSIHLRVDDSPGWNMPRHVRAMGPGYRRVMARLRDIVIDCSSAPDQARFWAGALDGYELRPYDDAEIERLASRGFTPETDPSVADDGPGVSESLRGRIFEPFFSTWPGGRGLGLAISRDVLRDHGGTVTCEERTGGGALFVMCVPSAA